jgi:hypothetical protein
LINGKELGGWKGSRSFGIQMIETFVSFVIFVVNDISYPIQDTRRKA